MCYYAKILSIRHSRSWNLRGKKQKKSQKNDHAHAWWMIYLYSWQTKQYSKKCKCTDVGEASYWDSSIRLAMGIAVLGALATVATFARLIWSISHGGFTLSKVPGCWLVTGYVTGHVIGRHRVDPLFLGDFLFSWQIRWMEWGLSSCFFVFCCI